jgi:Transposase and inactivated derivatives
MQLKTILNSVTDYKSFVVKKIRSDEETSQIEIDIEPRKNSQGVCPECGTKCPTYDTAEKPRRFEFIPLWAIPVYFLYKMRRIECKRHGVKTEKVPWSDGKSNLTVEYMQFLANWARRLSYTEVAKVFGTTWGKVYRSVEYIVEWGLKHRSLEKITSIGVDEICYKVGRKFLTLVYQIDSECCRLLFVSVGRTEKSLKKFFVMLNKGTVGKAKRSLLIKFVCSDMWKPYLNVIAAWCPNALNILDRFHIKKHLNNAVDQTRREEVKRLKEKGKGNVLKKSRFLFLYNRSNLVGEKLTKLKELLSMNLRVVRAYLMKEEFGKFWDYVSPAWAEWFLDKWCVRAMRSKIEPMKKFVGTIRNHKDLILNWFKSKGMSSGIVEGFNNKVKLTMRKSYGFRTEKALEVSLFHALGKLPEPEFTHIFW